MPEQEIIPDTQRVRADDPAIAEAARILAAGGLVAFPTETVYGLGADATNGAAVARLYAAKGRPTFNPLIVHVADRAAAQRLGKFDAAASALAAALWPGPLTLVLPKADDCPIADLATAGLDTIAARVPAHPAAKIQKFTKIRQRQIGANKPEFPIRSRFNNTDVKKLKPLSGIDI